MPCGLLLPWSLCCLLSSLSCAAVFRCRRVLIFFLLCYVFAPCLWGCPCLSLSIISFSSAKVLKCIDMYKFFSPSIVRFVNTYRPICHYIVGTSSRESGARRPPSQARAGVFGPCGAFGPFFCTPARAWLGGTPRDPRAPGAARRQEHTGVFGPCGGFGRFCYTPVCSCLHAAPPPRPPTCRVFFSHLCLRAFTFLVASWFQSARYAATPDAHRKEEKFQRFTHARARARKNPPISVLLAHFRFPAR